MQDTEEMNAFRLTHLGILFKNVEGESIVVVTTISLFLFKVEQGKNRAKACYFLLTPNKGD